MARLIPNHFQDDTPRGERQVFRKVQQSGNDWTVIHSLELAPWNKQRRTEIDFLVIIPGSGILCIEVKSHDTITFDGKIWHPKASIKRSPFVQAQKARYTFRDKLHDLHPSLKRIPISHLCIFTHSPFTMEKNLSVADFELMDKRAFHALADPELFCEDLQKRLERGIAADPSLNPLSRPVNKKETGQIVRCCGPVQTYSHSNREEIEERKRKADRQLRKQQKPILNLTENNERVIISGGAGTGKTLIAMEVALRAAEKKRQRVAFLCYNTLIGNWVVKEINKKHSPPNLTTGRIISILSELTGIKIDHKRSGNQSYWDRELPKQIEEKITDPETKSEALFDYMVIDEAQDILAKTSLWNCLRNFLKGGIENGSFALFGDFENQVLTDEKSRSEMANNLKEIKAVNTVYPLMENCRNYKIVGDTAVRLAGLNPDTYSGFMRTEGIEWYNISYYENDEEQLQQLRDTISGFRKQSYETSEITILSYRKDSESAAARLRDKGFSLTPLKEQSTYTGDSPGYGTIHYYKGMENKVIIMTDMLVRDTDFDRSVFYTALTRTTEHVKIICDKKSQKTILSWSLNK